MERHGHAAALAHAEVAARGHPFVVLAVAFAALSGALLVSVWFYPGVPAAWLVRAPLAAAAAGLAAAGAAYRLGVADRDAPTAWMAAIASSVLLLPAFALAILTWTGP